MNTLVLINLMERVRELLRDIEHQRDDIVQLRRAVDRAIEALRQ